MPLLTQRQVRQRKEELRKEKGDKCHAGIRCKHIPGPEYRTNTGEDLMLDHIDNNRENNDDKNHQLICRSCNAAKNPRGKTRFDRHKTLKTKTKTIMREREGGRVSVRAGELLDTMRNGLTYEQMKNQRGKKKFLDWVHEKVRIHSCWPIADVINAGAVIADVEIQTTERWLKPHLSSEGIYDTYTAQDGVNVLIFKGKPPRENSTGPS